MINLKQGSKVVATTSIPVSKRDGKSGKALDALGHAGGKSLKTTGRTLSKEARKRIADAQRLRWAKVRKEAAKLVKT